MIFIFLFNFIWNPFFFSFREDFKVLIPRSLSWASFREIRKRTISPDRKLEANDNFRSPLINLAHPAALYVCTTTRRERTVLRVFICRRRGLFPPRGMRRFMNQPPLRVLLLSRLRSEQKMDYYDSLRSFHLAIFRLKNSSNEKPKNLQERKVENS